MSIEKRLTDIVLEFVDVEESDIEPDASLLSDLGATSVDLIEIAAAIENEFDIDIPRDDLPSLRTVRALVEYIEKRIGQRG